MKTQRSIPLCNITRSLPRSIGLMILSVLLSFTILGGSLMVTGLRSGLSSLEARLGADVMVVPYEATTKSSLSDMFLQGNTGYFYMNISVLDKLKSIEGVGEISEQFYLASSSSSCCSIAVQIIGFNPESDFTISPWISTGYKKSLEYMEVVVGSDLNVTPGETLSFYGSECVVAAKMDKTGTYLDASVYADEETIKTIIQSAYDKKMYNFGDISPDEIVSCVLINAADGYTAEDVANEINLHVRGVEAVQTQSLVSDVAGGISGVAGIVSGLIIVIWLLALFILILAFWMISNERKKEFAVLRTLGASRKKLAGILMKEALFISLIGSVIGSVLAAAVLFLFSNLIESSLGLPFLLPSGVSMLLLFVISTAAAVITGSLAASCSAFRISRIDTALILRREN